MTYYQWSPRTVKKLANVLTKSTGTNSFKYEFTCTGASVGGNNISFKISYYHEYGIEVIGNPYLGSVIGNRMVDEQQTRALRLTSKQQVTARTFDEWVTVYNRAILKVIRACGTGRRSILVGQNRLQEKDRTLRRIAKRLAKKYTASMGYIMLLDGNMRLSGVFEENRDAQIALAEACSGWLYRLVTYCGEPRLFPMEITEVLK